MNITDEGKGKKGKGKSKEPVLIKTPLSIPFSFFLFPCLITFSLFPFPFSLAQRAYAEAAGTTSVDFLKIPIGARQSAMGGAATGLADDINAVAYNPATLAAIQDHQVSMLYTRWFQSIRHEYLGYAHPTTRYGTFGGSLQYLSYGTIDAYDSGGSPSGSVSANDMAFNLSWGGNLNRQIGLGMTGKLIREKLDDVTGQSVALDAGVTYRPEWRDQPTNWSFGLAMVNAGPAIKFDQEKSPLPRALSAGVGYKAFAETLKLDMDMVLPSDGGMGVRMGAEYIVKSLISLRTGYKSDHDLGNGFSFGAGLKLGDLIGVGDASLDYALVDYGVLGSTHRVGIVYRFGGAAGRYYQEGLELMRQHRYAEAILKFDKVLELDPQHRAAIRRIKECNERLDE